MKKRINTFPVLVIAFFCFLGVYIYPFVADRWNAYRSSQLIEDYHRSVVGSVDEDRYEEEYAKAVIYNENLAERTDSLLTSEEKGRDEEYEGLVNINNEGMMGYIEIPRLQIEVPIYHYSNDEVLDKGIGHIHGTSLPIGGGGTHSILTGHRGLPSSKLFTDLDQVEIGDCFYIYTLGHDLAYEVEEIQTVLPEEVESLVIREGEDLVTLVTCTPYGVNTHRLLVTGVRCEYDLERRELENRKGRTQQIQSKITPQNALVIGLVVFVVIIVVSMIVSGRKEKNKDET